MTKAEAQGTSVVAVRVRDELVEEMELITEYRKLLNMTELARSWMNAGLAEARKDGRYLAWKREREQAKAKAEKRAEVGVIE